jgi:RimJ/RimL family protein N-acetyltransferase
VKLLENFPEEKLKLRRFSKGDYATLISWIPDKDALVLCSGRDFHFPLDIPQLDNYLNRKDKIAFSAIDSNGRHFGHADIVLDQPATGRICRVIINPLLRGQGLGKLFVKKLVAAALQISGVEKVTLNVLKENTIATRCYEKCGFEEVPGKSFSFDYDGISHHGFLMQYNPRKA